MGGNGRTWLQWNGWAHTETPGSTNAARARRSINSALAGKGAVGR